MAQMEEVILQLLAPNNESIKEATQQLKIAVKDPGIVPALCGLLGTSQNVQVRQYAAILLKNCLKSKKKWQSSDTQVSITIRQNILQVLLQEPERPVRKAICQLVGVIAKHDLPDGRWPELFQFLQTYITSESPQQREIGMYVLQTLTSRCGEQLKPHFESLLQLCATTLEDKDNHLVLFYTIQTLTEMVPLMGSPELKPFQGLLPKIVAVIGQLVTVDEDQATEALEVLDELVESEVAIIVPHIRAVVEFCLQLASNKELSDSLRVKALSFISQIVRLKRKMIIKLKMINSLINTLFPILCEMPDDDQEDEDFDENETHVPSSYAGQVLDVMCLNLPPEKFVPAMMRMVEPSLQSKDPHHRKAGYTAMAVSAEGSADYIMSKLLKPWLAAVYKGLQDPEPVVRNAALFALGQFSEHLQPDISKYSTELLPLLFDYLGKASQNIDKDPRGATKTYYALETFVENLGKEILPHLPQLMEYLLTSISSSPSYRAKELAISALAATANAAEKDIVPYFPHIVEQFKAFLQPTEDEHQLKVQVQALEKFNNMYSIDTLGVLARTMKEHFEPLATECVNLGLTLMENATDPDLRRCIYGMFAAVSTILKDRMSQHLEVMVKAMLTSLKSTEGITAHYDENESQIFSVFDEEDIEDEEEANEGVEGFSVENAFLDEKGDACSALGELAVNIGGQFLTYMEECYREVSDLLDYPAEDVRCSAITAVSQFCCAVHQVARDTNATDAHTALHSMLSHTVPKFLVFVKQDKERKVVTTTLEELKNMLDQIGAPVLQADGMVDNFLTAVRDVILRKTSCQDEVEEEEEADDEEAELDSMLVEDAGDLLPSVAKVIGGEAFAPYFAGFLPELVKKTRKSCPVSDRSFAVGTMADSLHAMGGVSQQFVNHLYPLFSKMCKDEDEEVRSNSVYALGVLAQNGGSAIYTQYPQILKILFDILNRESDGRCLDNVCAAVCRMIDTRTQDIPLHQVLPAVLQCLPLKEDQEEYETVYKCLCRLHAQSLPELNKHLPQLVTASAAVLANPQLKQDVKQLVCELLQSISHQQPDMVTTVMSSIPQQHAATLQQCLAITNGS